MSTYLQAHWECRSLFIVVTAKCRTSSNNTGFGFSHCIHLLLSLYRTRNSFISMAAAILFRLISQWQGVASLECWPGGGSIDFARAVANRVTGHTKALSHRHCQGDGDTHMINFCNPITDVNDSVSRHNIESWKRLRDMAVCHSRGEMVCWCKHTCTLVLLWCLFVKCLRICTNGTGIIHDSDCAMSCRQVFSKRLRMRCRMAAIVLGSITSGLKVLLLILSCTDMFSELFVCELCCQLVITWGTSEKLYVWWQLLVFFEVTFTF